MARKKYRKMIACILAVAISGGIFTDGSAGTALAAGNGQETGTSSASFSIERLTSGYTNISAGYTAADYLGEEKIFHIEDAIASEDSGLLTDESYGYDGRVADVQHGTTLSLTIDAPETGLYWMNFDYLSYDESILPIEFALKIDGEYPFYEARNLTFETYWVQD